VIGVVNMQTQLVTVPPHTHASNHGSFTKQPIEVSTRVPTNDEIDAHLCLAVRHPLYMKRLPATGTPERCCRLMTQRLVQFAGATVSSCWVTFYPGWGVVMLGDLLSGVSSCWVTFHQGWGGCNVHVPTQAVECSPPCTIRQECSPPCTIRQ
jgi:hypothetical protein